MAMAVRGTAASGGGENHCGALGAMLPARHQGLHQQVAGADFWSSRTLGSQRHSLHLALCGW